MVGLNDIFNTDRDLSWTKTSFSESERYRKRQSRELRVNVSWRFGKMDAKLFSKKKRGEEGGGDMGAAMASDLRIYEISSSQTEIFPVILR